MRTQTGALPTLLAVGAFLLTATASMAQQAASAQSKVVAYVPNWIDLNAFADAIDYAHITHINLAFENPVNAAGDLSFNRADAILIARAHAHHIPVLISIGGGSASGDKTLMVRYFDLLTDPRRPAFAAKLAAYVEAHHFDGLDVDLEGPSVNKDYGAFVQDLSRALKPKGRLLTAPCQKGTEATRFPMPPSRVSIGSTSWRMTRSATGTRTLPASIRL